MSRQCVASPSSVLYLVLATALLFAACGGEEPAPAPDPDTTAGGGENGNECQANQPWAAGFLADHCEMADGSLPPVTPVYWPDVCIPNLTIGWTPTQTGFDQLSWRSFFNASWPAGADGQPDTSKLLGLQEDGVFLPTVWERYHNAEDLFGPNGAALTVADYASPSPVPEGCDPEGPRVLTMTSKFQHSAMMAVTHALEGAEAAGEAGAAEGLDSIDQAFRGPLYPQGPDPLMPVFYEIRINDVEYKAIVEAVAQTKSPAELNCTGEYATSTCTPFSFPFDSTEVKAAWKVLSTEEVSAGTFFYQDLQVKDPATGSCTVKPMGLVGLHIARKVKHAISSVGDGRKNSWAWATFEHNGNVPPVGSDGTGGAWSFNDPSCTPAVDAATCAAAATPANNQPNPDPAYQCCPNLYRYAAGTVPTDPTPDQVTRIDEAPETTQVCNEIYARTDKGVFNNYNLVVTQWPQNSDGGGGTTVTPAVARNTVIETYFVQWNNGAQVNTSSCMGCHSGSKAVDMSYLFLNNTGS